MIHTRDTIIGGSFLRSGLDIQVDNYEQGRTDFLDAYTAFS
jgi:hypothetical protein